MLGRRNLPKPSTKPATLRLSPGEERVLFEKTNPIFERAKWTQSNYLQGLTAKMYDLAAHENKAKQSQYAGHWPEIYAIGIRSTKLEIRNNSN